MIYEVKQRKWQMTLDKVVSINNPQTIISQSLIFRHDISLNLSLFWPKRVTLQTKMSEAIFLLKKLDYFIFVQSLTAGAPN